MTMKKRINSVLCGVILAAFACAVAACAAAPTPGPGEMLHRNVTPSILVTTNAWQAVSNQTYALIQTVAPSPGNYAAVSNAAMSAAAQTNSFLRLKGGGAVTGDVLVVNGDAFSGGKVKLTSEAGGPVIEMEDYNGFMWIYGYGWMSTPFGFARLPEGEGTLAYTSYVDSAADGIMTRLGPTIGQAASASAQSAATAANLAENYYTKTETDSAISSMAAYYITYSSQGGAFPTLFSLTNSSAVYYSGGLPRTPSRNDYAVVLADESHSSEQWRYVYSVSESGGTSAGQWDAQYRITMSDYNSLTHLPQVNGVTLAGDKSSAELGLANASITNAITSGALPVPQIMTPDGTRFIDATGGVFSVSREKKDDFFTVSNFLGTTTPCNYTNVNEIAWLVERGEDPIYVGVGFLLAFDSQNTQWLLFGQPKWAEAEEAGGVTPAWISANRQEASLASPTGTAYLADAFSVYVGLSGEGPVAGDFTHTIGVDTTTTNAVDKVVFQSELSSKQDALSEDQMKALNEVTQSVISREYTHIDFADGTSTNISFSGTLDIQDFIDAGIFQPLTPSGGGWVRSPVTNDIGSLVTAMERYIFQGCHDLKVMRFSTSMKVVPEEAVSYCETLENVEIPEGITEIGSSVFLGCTNLRSITIPSTVSSVGAGAFAGSGIKEVVVFGRTAEEATNLLSNAFGASVAIPGDVVIKVDSFVTPTALNIRKIADVSVQEYMDEHGGGGGGEPPVYFTNDTYSVIGFTGLVVTATQEVSGRTFVTNAITLFPRQDEQNTYTNSEYVLALLKNTYTPVAVQSEDLMYYLFSNGGVQTNYPFADSIPDSDIAFSYEGASLESATRITLPYSHDGMVGSFALVLFRERVSDYEKMTRHVKYNDNIAARYSDESLRLATPDGLTWIDATGVVWEVSGKYEVDAYSVLGSFLYKVPVGDLPSEVERYENETWRMTFQRDDGTYSEFGGTWTLSKPSDSSFVPKTAYGDEWPALGFDSGWPRYELFTTAYPAVAYTNGDVRVHAVRKVLFSDDLGSASLNAKTVVDGVSVSTNSAGALEVSGFEGVSGGLIPVSESDEGTGKMKVSWMSAEQIGEAVASAIAKSGTWSQYGIEIYNCYVQVGNKVYAAGTGAQSKIPLSGKVEGNYGVGIRYAPEIRDYEIAFDLVSNLENSTEYETYVYVGNLSTESGRRVWNGIASIPVIMVFE